VRRFGTWLLLEPGELEPYLGTRVGEEPLDALFTVARLGERLARRRAPIKSALLDQRTLAGMGNIYVDEALWRAKVHPLRAAESLDRNELRRLHKAVRAALEAGIARQGSTLRDYALPDGGSGSMQHEFKVYGRDGEPCDRCGTPISKTRVAGRGTWFCSSCQSAQAASSSSRPPSRSRRQSSV
jgi:formamidopyrimidine-DNA glycosylase